MGRGLREAQGSWGYNQGLQGPQGCALLPGQGPDREVGPGLTDEFDSLLSQVGLSILQVWQASFHPADLLLELEKAQGRGAHIPSPASRTSPSCQHPPPPFPQAIPSSQPGALWGRGLERVRRPFCPAAKAQMS